MLVYAIYCTRTWGRFFLVLPGNPNLSLGYSVAWKKAIIHSASKVYDQFPYPCIHLHLYTHSQMYVCIYIIAMVWLATVLLYKCEVKIFVQILIICCLFIENKELGDTGIYRYM